MKNFKQTRKIFKEIKRKIESKKNRKFVEEFEKAASKLLLEYDTKIWENRFTVGGALEILFYALLKSLKFKTKLLREARYDIEIKGLKFSLKSNFTGSGDIRLINILGEKEAFWKEPTIFFISGLGICYADPKLGLKTKHTSDALVLNVKEIKLLVEKEKNFEINIQISKKPKKILKNKIASHDVAISILKEIKSKYLKNYLPSL